MDLGDQRAGGVEDVEAALFGFASHRLRHAVGAEDQGGAVGNLAQVFDEDGALGLEVIDHVAVVHDFVADVDRAAKLFQRAFDDSDGTLDTGAEATGIGKQEVHHMIPRISTSKRIDLPASG
jgi:hypothetical protein